MNGFRRLIIKTAEVMMVLLVIVTIFSFAASGWMYGVDLGPGFFAPVLGFIIGGLIGLAIASVTASMFFLVLEIAENTRPGARSDTTPGAP
ncbi:hypothetical protein NP284_36050 [Rhodopseudomonas pseudopalustris]|uniref:hypothetical protein n=1 Tax=Rhodopseudomonas pseudopalustris TaxID=1513892 RepID=UPI00121AF072|nr:MAG: hypothetical protein EWM45_16415 [Rhodopseudomonas palustris]